MTQLFDPRFAEILHDYPLAEAASPDIRRAVASGSVAIEAFLRDHLRDSADAYARRRFRQIPLYLQELLYRVSELTPQGFTIHPDNYDALLNATLELQDVVFISLNYDTLLDQRLGIYQPLDSVDAYVEPTRNWSLVKLHGSVNWARPVTRRTDAHLAHPTIGLLNHLFDEVGDDEITQEIVIRSGNPTEMRYAGRQLYYPALSVPLGAKDELVCPDSHLEYVRKKLAEFDPLNLLVIGYSGLDQEVLTLLCEPQRRPAHLMVVNGTKEHGELAAAAVDGLFGRPRRTEGYVWDGGFSSFVAAGALEEFVSRLG